MKIDLLLIADDTTIRHLHEPENPNPLAAIRTKVRRRDIMLFVVKPWGELVESGYADFLDSLGLTYLGTCR